MSTLLSVTMVRSSKWFFWIPELLISILMYSELFAAVVAMCKRVSLISEKVSRRSWEESVDMVGAWEAEEDPLSHLDRERPFLPNCVKIGASCEGEEVDSMMLSWEGC